MNLFCFELGRQKQLCEAELLEIIGESRLFEKGIDALIFKTNLTDPQKIQDSLGGTIKIAEILKTSSQNDLKKDIEEIILREFKNSSGKIPFSISLLNYKNPKEINIKDLLNFSKKILKSLGMNSRFVNKDFRSPKPSTIFKAKVIQKGIDLCLIKSNDQIHISKSVAIQNIDNYSKRDFDKPGRDARTGMLPPKLAQIMLNLAGKNTHTIYDPFCGTGTILMEGLLLGKRCIGSDIDPRMIEFSDKNLSWLRENFRIPESALNRCFTKDATELSKQDLPENIEAIVTESYLGPPLSKLPESAELQKNIEEIEDLHRNWLKKAAQLLESGKRLVTCVPAFKDRNKLVHIESFDEIAKKSGFKVLSRFTYHREDQIVARDIKVLEKI